MLYTGLVSITFRQLKPARIVDLVRQAGLDSIEWGGDVHVPPGDVQRARDVAQMTRDAGLTVSAYGSYYRLRPDEPTPFEAVLATAVELGAPTIRVWAGDKASADVDYTYRQRIISESRRVADLAAAENITLSYEYHRNTLTDNRRSAVKLLDVAQHPQIKSFWQPNANTAPHERLADLEALEPWLTNVHVFQWGPGGYQDRRLLADGTAEWATYLEKIASIPGDRHLSIEFVLDDKPEIFLQDAATLKQWLAPA
jgi:sugar phosphate isomerase/epimerase